MTAATMPNPIVAYRCPVCAGLHREEWEAEDCCTVDDEIAWECANPSCLSDRGGGMTARTHSEPHNRSHHPRTSMRQIARRRSRRRLRELWRQLVRAWRGTGR